MVSITHSRYDDTHLDRELRDIILAIKELQSGTVLSSSVSVSTGSSSSGGGSSSGSTELRHGIIALSSGSNVILFSTAMPAASFTLPRLRCYTTVDGPYEDVEAVVSAKTINGFTVDVIKACTCEYVALY